MHAYKSCTDRVLDDAEYRRLAKATSGAAYNLQVELVAPSEALTVACARQARLDPTLPFGRYEFSYGEIPPAPVQLSCKAWETAWSHPASVWLSDVVGAKNWPEGNMAWSRTIGTWMHRWMKEALDRCEKNLQPGGLLTQLRAVAGEEEARLQTGVHSLGIELVPWWGQVHRQARSIALQLGEALAPSLREPFFSEYRLPRDLFVALPGDDRADFLLRGRLDLVLVERAEGPREAHSFTGDTCWVIDFKTGSARGLSEKEILQGRGLQTVLYALALREAGAVSTAISLLSVGEPLARQIDLARVLEMKSIFRSLDQFHRRGVFGMRPGMESSYGYNPV